jgi:hypothetical protein
MCIPPSMQKKLVDYYEETGQSDKAALQRRSLENTANVMARRINVRKESDKKISKATTLSRSHNYSVVSCCCYIFSSRHNLLLQKIVFNNFLIHDPPYPARRRRSCLSCFFPSCSYYTKMGEVAILFL